VLHDQQAEQHLSRRRVAAMDEREAVAARQVRAHPGVQLVVFEQPIQLHQHRIGLVGQLRHAREDVLGLVAVDEHGAASLPPMVRPAAGHSTARLARRSAPILGSYPSNRTAS
jgi:hypothetical protein